MNNFICKMAVLSLTQYVNFRLTSVNLFSIETDLFTALWEKVYPNSPMHYNVDVLWGNIIIFSYFLSFRLILRKTVVWNQRAYVIQNIDQ